jgi:hypothetical protein
VQKQERGLITVMGGGRSPSYSFGHPRASCSATTDLLATNKADYRGSTAFLYSRNRDAHRAEHHKRVEYSVYFGGAARVSKQYRVGFSCTKELFNRN